MTQKELDEILDNAFSIASCPGISGTQRHFVLLALKNSYNKGVIDSSESAECEGVNKITFDKVNKQSILKLLIP